MYCKHCGKEIDDNSSFCKHCGKPQNSNQTAFSISKGWIVYIIWSIINMYLLIGDKYHPASKYFYPFTSDDIYYSWDKGFYDFSEFIVYVFILPAILYIVYRHKHTQIDSFINKLLNK